MEDRQEVKKIETRQFMTGSFKPRGGFLPDEDSDKLIGCVDIILLKREGKERLYKMLLGKRTQEPWPDWFIIGGRMMLGKTFKKVAAHNIKRELGLDVETSRFQYLGTYAYIYGTRSQPPQENGSHTVSITMVLEIDDREATAIKPNNEFSELEWVRPEIVKIQTGLHPAVIQYAKDLIKFLRKRNE